MIIPNSEAASCCSTLWQPCRAFQICFRLKPFRTHPWKPQKTLQNRIKLWTPSNTSTTFQNPEFSNVRNLPREPVRKRLPELSLREPTCQHSGPPLSLILAETPKVLGKKVYFFLTKVTQLLLSAENMV